MSKTGKESQQWLLSYLKDVSSPAPARPLLATRPLTACPLATIQVVAEFNPNMTITFEEFEHTWAQNSIIVTMEAPRAGKDAAPVVLSQSAPTPLPHRTREEKLTPSLYAGSHLDSIAMFPFSRAPGAGEHAKPPRLAPQLKTDALSAADDDGSAVTVLVTAFVALLKTGFVPTAHPLAFHFYAAEEGGLLGSKAVAKSWALSGQSLKGLLHMCVLSSQACDLYLLKLSASMTAGTRSRTSSLAQHSRSGCSATSEASTRT